MDYPNSGPVGRYDTIPKGAKNWLVPVDGSEGSVQAVEHCIRLMDIQNDILYILTVHPIKFGDNEKKREKARKSGEEILVKFEEIARRAGVKFKSFNMNAPDPGEEICQQAALLGATYLVIGNRGLGSMQKLLLGSTSDYVCNHAPCPVIVARKYSS